MKRGRVSLLLLLATFLMLSCKAPVKEERVKLGIDVLLDCRIRLLEGKRIGLITNATGVTGELQSTIEAFHEDPRINLVALFAPEHGIRGDIQAGDKLKNHRDKVTNLPVYSLYGETRKPTPEMLKEVDVLVFDIQDVGARFYTYIYTMAYAMEGAKEGGKEFVVLDRPNPLGGLKLEGYLLEDRYRSFIGLYPIPILHGMTIGELAKMFNREFEIGVDLTVVEMEGWKREMTFDATSLVWIPTSPNIPKFGSAFLYPGMGLLGEAGVVSVGIGTALPFEVVGAPWLDGELLAEKLNSSSIPGVFFRPTYFMPTAGKFEWKRCSGVEIHVLDREKVMPFKLAIEILTTLRELYPKRFRSSLELKREGFNKAAGTDKLYTALVKGVSAKEIVAGWEGDLKKFAQTRKKYLIYN